MSNSKPSSEVLSTTVDTTTDGGDQSPAQTAWFEQVGCTFDRDRPQVNVWCPRSLPTARLDTVNVGSFREAEERLTTRTPTAHITVAGVDIGGPLEDLVLLFAAANEVLAELVDYAGSLKRVGE